MRFRIWNENNNLNICFVCSLRKTVTNRSVPPLFKLVLRSWSYFGASSSPILLIPAQPIPLCARWAWYELGKQTADTLRYFLTLHQLSFPAAPRQLAVRNSPSVELRLFCFTPTGLLSTGCRPQYQQERLATSPTSTTLIFIKWGEQTAPVRAKRRQHFEQASLQEPSCTSDRRQL